MKFPSGITAETCFAVSIPSDEAAKRIKYWDPSLRGTLKTLLFHKVSNPSTLDDFSALTLDPSKKPHRWLLDKTQTPLKSTELNLTREEAEQIAEHTKSERDPQTIGTSWAGILQARAAKFQKDGFSGMKPYELTGQDVLPADHLKAMLKERPAVAAEFKSLLNQIGILGEKPTANLDPFYYWALYEANRHATLTLGAVYLTRVGDRYQLLDVQYYVSGTYYTFVTLYEVLPVKLRGKPAALVWRGDFFSAPTLAYTKGVERLAYGAFMLQELKKTIRSFQKDATNRSFDPESTPTKNEDQTRP